MRGPAIQLLASLLALGGGANAGLFAEGAPPPGGGETALTLDHEPPHGLVIRAPHLPGGLIRINYLEAYCRAGSTDADWVRHTVIPHRQDVLSLSEDRRVLKLRDVLADGVTVDHTITARDDEVDFRLVAHNPGAVRSEAHWAQPCVRLAEFTGHDPKGKDLDDYLPKAFIFLNGRLTRMSDIRPWAKQARYVPGQVWCPKGVPRTDVNPRPLSPLVPECGLIGAFSGDGKRLFATAWEPYQELFQGVIRCVHSDLRLGGLLPGETKRIKGKIYLIAADEADLLRRYKRDFPEQCAEVQPAQAKPFAGFERGMGIGGWLTNYKRFNVLPDAWKMALSPGDYEHFESYITKDDVRNIASFGVDHIRLGFDQVVLEEKPYVYRERTFRCIDNFVAWCREANVNVVLNLHKAVGNYCDVPSPVELLDDAELQNRFVALWLEFERRYHADNRVVFELLNEVKNVDPKAWNTLAARTISELRKLNPTRKIVVGSTCWNSCGALKDLRLFDDENVIYTFHFYDPFEFTHQRGVLQAGPLYYNRAMPYPGDIGRYRDYKRFVEGAKNPYPRYQRLDSTVLREWLQPAFEFARKHPDKILWCGEFGTIRHCDMASRENWMNDVILLLKEHGISYCVWNYLSTPNDGNRFSLVDDDKRHILSPRMLAIIQGKVEPLRKE